MDNNDRQVESTFLTMQPWRIIARDYLCGVAILALVFSAGTLFWGNPNDFHVALICGIYIILQGLWDCFIAIRLKNSTSQTFDENSRIQKFGKGFFSFFVYGLSLPGTPKIILGVILLVSGGNISHVVLVGLLAAFLGINFFENGFFMWIINKSPFKDIKAVRSLRNDFGTIAFVYLVGCIIMVAMVNSDGHAALGIMSSTTVVIGILSAVTVFTNIFNERDVQKS